jgi:hypothetical protein
MLLHSFCFLWSGVGAETAWMVANCSSAAASAALLQAISVQSEVLPRGETYLLLPGGRCLVRDFPVQLAEAAAVAAAAAGIYLITAFCLMLAAAGGVGAVAMLVTFYMVIGGPEHVPAGMAVGMISCVLAGSGIVHVSYYRYARCG